MKTYSIPDITPGGSAVKVSASLPTGYPNSAVWVNMTASGTSIRYGDANTGTAQGQALTTGVPFLACPRCDNPQGRYDLTQLYVFASGGDKVSITFGV